MPEFQPEFVVQFFEGEYVYAFFPVWTERHYLSAMRYAASHEELTGERLVYAIV